MTEIIQGEDARREFHKAFDKSRDKYFNNGVFRGALRIPMGFPFHVTPKVPANIPNISGRILATDYMLGKHGEKTDQLARILMELCFPTPEDRTKMWVPVFRARPILEISSYDAAGWPVGAWCDMVWAPSTSDLTGLEPAWP